MSRELRVDLDRPREVPALIGDALRIWVRNLRVFLPIAVVVVVPVDAAVLGLGLGEFHGGYTSSPPVSHSLITLAAQLLVSAPLVNVMTLHALMQISHGERPSARRSIVAGLDAFSTVFWPVLVMVAVVAATVWILVGIVLFVRWYFIPQVVVVDRRSGLEPLRASWDLTRGYGLRVAGIVLLTNLMFGLVGGAVSGPLLSLAKSADSQALALAWTTLLEVLVAAPAGLVAALMFFDLRARGARRVAA